MIVKMNISCINHCSHTGIVNTKYLCILITSVKKKKKYNNNQFNKYDTFSYYIPKKNPYQYYIDIILYYIIIIQEYIVT